ncbi:MAG: hypothetical protein A2Y31_02855 [Spirochaetes bacterium GWC2_52_13]|nr:MAG: hypothetical protein A2Y31_02855 [Spirochaetes bacterium GWC2_52_13]HCG63218.1 hypothetical protein [Sphaerochaeta sp.]
MVRLLVVLAGVALVSIGCTGMDRIVIDGEAAQQMANRINDQLFDPEGALRGNSASNMRNGGYVQIHDKALLVINSMTFEDGSVVRYLQHLPVSQIGSTNARNDILAPLDGTLVGMHGRHIVYIDAADNNQLFSLDTQTFAVAQLLDVSVESAHMLGDTVYASTLGDGNLWSIQLVDDAEGLQLGLPQLVYRNAGDLVGVSQGIAYMLANTGGASVIRRIDIAKKMMAGRLVGGPYEDIQLAGSWLYYKQGTTLMRQQLVGGYPEKAFYQDVDEYAVWGHWLAATCTNGGIYVSHLDGSALARIVSDGATGLQLLDNKVFYRNANDNGAVYVFDLVEGTRSALLGPTVTDGGLQFSTIQGQDLDLFAAAFTPFVTEVADKHSLGDQYWGDLQGEVLFVEIPADGSPLLFHRHTDDAFTPDQVGALVVVSTVNTVLGQYTDGGIAYRQDAALTLFGPDDDMPHLTWIVEGRPPSEIKIGSGDRYGIPLPWDQKALDLRDLVRSRQGR